MSSSSAAPAVPPSAEYAAYRASVRPSTACPAPALAVDPTPTATIATVLVTLAATGGSPAASSAG
ncbi:Uncharacterised protein [Mycobacteroides abscessus subsp. abscessus]|nr:Uncharacterised protein [Mycobacteroides abscessus subsp. abscessus]